jgi:hypothetical protein
LQVFQRVLELRNKTLSDAVYDTCVALQRIASFEGASASDKAAMKGAVIYRFDHVFYSPAVALACFLDPRFDFRMEGLDVSWSSHNFAEDAYACLEQKIKHLPSDVCDEIKEQYGDLREGNLFDKNDPDDARRLREAHDMPLWKWARLHKIRPSCAALFTHVLVPIFSLPITADGCEHGNNVFKWVQAGRVSLSDEHARQLVYVVINMRLLKQHKALADIERVANGFKPGWGWPPVSNLADTALAFAVAEPNPELAAAHTNLRCWRACPIAAAALSLWRCPPRSSARARGASPVGALPRATSALSSSTRPTPGSTPPSTTF